MADTHTRDAERGIPGHAGDGARTGGEARDPMQGFNRQKCLDLLADMLLFRRFEEHAEEAYAIGKIGGFCHLHIGQEAAAAGTIKPLRRDDYVITAYREHTQALAKGVHPRQVMAELFGKVSGTSKGNGGSMHLFSAINGFMGGHGIVGAQTALGTGLAWAIRYRGGDQVCLCFMGDAAVNQGAFHESLNMAAIWNLPIIFVVENNDYGMGTKFSRVSTTPVVQRACAYDIPSSQVDGQDVLATYRHFEGLVSAVRAGGGPRYVDVLTYRFKGHSMSDPVSGTYRSKEEVDNHITHQDPIKMLRDRMMMVGWLNQSELEQIDEKVREICDAAVQHAEEAELPPPDQLYQNVYSEINEHGRLFFDGRDR